LPADLAGAGKDLGVSTGAVFDRHVFEFAGFKDFAAFQALYEFGVFFTGHDLHAWMLTLIHFASLIGGWRRLDWSHKSGD
jgi:hypothetical protein